MSRGEPLVLRAAGAGPSDGGQEGVTRSEFYSGKVRGTVEKGLCGSRGEGGPVGGWSHNPGKRRLEGSLWRAGICVALCLPVSRGAVHGGTSVIARRVMVAYGRAVALGMERGTWL